MSDVTLPGEGSPFDRIRRQRADGTEYWSARELMEVEGYKRWEKFKNGLSRAVATAENQGHPAADHFRRSGEKVPIGSGAYREREDFELSRYGAYLVAMNGDPNMPEVAAAQSYFATQTRVAETRPAVDGASLSRIEILQIAVNAETERLALEAENRELAPKADAYETFIDATGHYSVGAVAKMLGSSQNKLFKELRNRGVLIAKGAMRNTPYQQYMHHFVVKAHDYERSNGEMGTSYTTYVQPSGIDFVRRKLGLPSIDPQLPVNGEGAA